MRARTPTTSAEAALEAHALTQHARMRGREPERTGPYGVLTWEGPLPPDHPLADTPSEARRKRILEERRKRGL